MQNTVIDEIWDEYPKFTETKIRNALASFLFRGEDVFKEIKKLSGGERARVELCKLILKEVNLLIMDEPTNHMDIESKEALEKALQDFGATLLIVSHDRYFINKLADKIYYMDESGLTCYDGNYEYFSQKLKEESQKTVQAKKVTASALDYKEQKRLESEKRKLNTKIQRTEEEIAVLEDKIEMVSKMLENPEISSDFQKAMELSDELSGLNLELEEKYTLWEELQSGREQI